MNLDNYKEELEILNNMHQTYSLLHIVSNRIQAEADAGLEDITSRQLMLLLAIKHLEEQEATIMNIAGMLGTSKQNITRLVNSMIQSGYLISKPGEKDKRNVNISITNQGLTVMQKNTTQSNIFFLNLFKDFSKNELSSLRTLLEKLDKYNPKQKHFEEKVSIDISSNLTEMEDFLNQIHKIYYK